MAARSKEIRYRPRAIADLEQIWRYTARTWSPEQANRYHLQITRRLERLAAGALSGTDCSHIRSGYFRLTVAAHHAYFRQHPYGIEIVRILHQSQDAARNI